MLNIVDSTKERILKTITMAKDNVVKVSIHQGWRHIKIPQNCNQKVHFFCVSKFWQHVYIKLYDNIVNLGLPKHSQIEASNNFKVSLILCMCVCFQIHLTLEEIVLCELAIALPWWKQFSYYWEDDR